MVFGLIQNISVISERNLFSGINKIVIEKWNIQIGKGEYWWLQWIQMNSALKSRLFRTNISVQLISVSTFSEKLCFCLFCQLTNNENTLAIEKYIRMNELRWDKYQFFARKVLSHRTLDRKTFPVKLYEPKSVGKLLQKCFWIPLLVRKSIALADKFRFTIVNARHFGEQNYHIL